MATKPSNEALLDERTISHMDPMPTPSSIFVDDWDDDDDDSELDDADNTVLEITLVYCLSMPKEGI